MKIGIVDADLLGRHRHRFPNLVCEKLSGYWKDHGAEVDLLIDYDNFDAYDHVYVSKVFTDTPVPKWLTETEKVHIFQPLKFCVNTLSYDASALIDDFEDLHYNVERIDIECPSSKEVIKYFEKVHDNLNKLNSNVYKSIRALDIQMSYINNLIV